MNIKTRFAPSPTGFIHIGNVRTALFSWLYAKKNNGEFIIRIDDTDTNRNSIIFKNNIINILNWLNIKSDSELIYQSKRYEIYRELTKKLINDGNAYKCYCSKERLTLLKETQIKNKEKVEYDGLCKHQNNRNVDFVVRINTENYDVINFNDTIKGTISFNKKEIDDFIIAKNEFYPTYNLASVIDDIQLNITNIIRGDDHISNTPKQVIIFNALNSNIPLFTHLPMILNENKKPLSKRDDDSRIEFYKEKGFLPDALLNYIVKLGWSNKDQEIFSIDEMIKFFDIKNIVSSPSILNKSKLIWLNKHYIKNSKNENLLKYILQIEKKFKINYTLGPNILNLIEINKNKINFLEEVITHNLFLYKKRIYLDYTTLHLYFSSKIITILKDIYIKIKKINANGI